MTGVALAPTIEFGDRLSARGTPIWVRFVLVPGLTDAIENVEAVAAIVEPLVVAHVPTASTRSRTDWSTGLFNFWLFGFRQRSGEQEQ